MSQQQDSARLALSLMDLTSLNDTDTNAIVEALCTSAKTPEGTPAAVCVYPAFINIARSTLNKEGLNNVLVATVTNFPHGSADIDSAVSETKQAVANGAHEVDVVFPYKSLLEGDSDIGYRLVQLCKAACGLDVTLKVIIESGELKTPELIRKASEICIAAGADFIKTSTGKVATNATPEAARIMIQAIKDSGENVGFKAAGGVRNVEDAQVYLSIAEEIMGTEWVTSNNFRFGASSLLSSLLNTLGHNADVQTSAKY